MEPVALRLKRLRESADPTISIRDMAKEMGVPHSTYAAKEDPSKFKKPILPLDLAKRIADILEPRGVNRADVLRLAGLQGSVTEKEVGAATTIWVIGQVEAGSWRDRMEWDAERRYEETVGPPQWPGVERFGLVVEGYSMDMVFKPGSVLECMRVPFNGSGLRPRPGDYVIVQRLNGELSETTCKLLELADDGSYELRCESSKPEFQRPIPIGKPDTDYFGDEEIKVIAIVGRAVFNTFKARR